MVGEAPAGIDVEHVDLLVRQDADASRRSRSMAIERS